ncbi:MAG: cyclic nucleotide-binding domain-containing protein [Phaeodactylibacter sp.]|nr:cyclic nucleotide-binding domain-containing protein [Phaeodactylibacter sp.]MCB9051544.1 cyclic nucleotide-binding domain-containing protein [Lewinellaceae bacterium]
MKLIDLHKPFFTNAWGFLIVALTAVLAIYLPLRFALGTQIAFYSYLEVGLTLIFVADLALLSFQFHQDAASGYFPAGQARPFYLQPWFVLNLLAAVPFIFFAPVGFSAFRLFKLARSSKILESWRLQNLQYSNRLALLYLIIAIIIIIHWFTCGWMVIRQVNEQAPDDVNRYIDALYWSVTTITTVGYGDITPITPTEKIYAIFAMLMGLGFYGFLIGNITRLLSKKDPAREHYLDNMEKLSVAIKYRSLPLSLQRRIHDYYSYKWRKRLGFDEEDFLEGLPHSLKRQVALHFKREILERIPMFSQASQEFIESIALHLNPAVFTPGDYIFRAGEAGEEMYFIVQGRVVVVTADEKSILSRLSDGDCFGEVALFLNKPRTATVIAEDYCDLYALSKDTFEEVIAQYPGFARNIETIALSREKNRPV